MRTAKQEVELSNKIYNLVATHIPGWRFVNAKPEDYTREYYNYEDEEELEEMLTNECSWLGLTNRFNKHIILSDFLYKQGTPAEIINVVLHEIAHALVNDNLDHSNEWVEKCISIGGDGMKYMVIGMDRKKGRWTFTGTNEAA